MTDFHQCEPLNLLTGLIWGEARGEPLLGKFAVGFIARNRVLDTTKCWPSTWAGVILQPEQFSCFNPDDPNYLSVIEHLHPSDVGAWHNPVWRECRYVAQGIVEEWVMDFTKSSNHYHSKQITPYWADSTKITMEIGNHVFYRL